MTDVAPPLSEATRRQLLDLARATLEAQFAGEAPPRLASDSERTAPINTPAHPATASGSSQPASAVELTCATARAA